MNKKFKWIIGLILIFAVALVGYKVVADYCYTSGLNGTIVTFISPRDYNFQFPTTYNDEYTKAGEPNANSFTITDLTTMKWYIPSGSWGVQASLLNQTFWQGYFSTLTITATFTDVHGTVAILTFGFASPISNMATISGADNGTIIVTIQGTVLSTLPAGQINIPCTALIEWCPDAKL